MRSPLPIDAVLPELIAALRTHSSVVLQAPTGAGKTTRIPPALVDAKFATSGQIVMLEPRRLAARAAANRIAQERNVTLGREVGYHVRFDRKSTRETQILVVTPGILLRMLHDDPFLERISVVLFDEFHERGLESDLALGLVRLIQETVRPELRIVAMSATLDVESVSRYLDDAPIVASEGRLFPVDIRYDSSIETVADGIISMLDQIDGDILAFLPGMGEIRRTMNDLSSIAKARNLLVLPLHGDLPLDQQEQALLPQRQRKIVLATNVAETSVTVEGVTCVVDSGLARVMVYDQGIGLDRLELQPISQASAAQRAGRAGRTQPGVCLRMWSPENHRTRPEHTAPEIARIDLTSALLHLLALGERDVRAFRWLDSPKESSIEQSLMLLHRLGAIDESNTITKHGQTMARLPIHPRLARMLMHGAQTGHHRRIALSAAMLSERNPFLRDLPHRISSPSDVLDRLEILEAFERDGTESCLNITAARFILRTRDQLVRSFESEYDCRSSRLSDPDEAVMQALLMGFPDRLAKRREAGGRTGVMVGGRGVRLAPSSRMTESELFICVDVDAGDRESWVRQASGVERSWLPAEWIKTGVEVEFDDSTEKVIARKRTRFDDLLLDESPASLPQGGEVPHILSEAALRDIDRVIPDGEARGTLCRIECLRDWMPELNLPAFDVDEWREVLTWVTSGCRSFDELRRADWVSAILGRLSRDQRHALDQHAPERIAVPSGSRIVIEYERGRSPILAVRIQEVFGLADTPRVAGGRIKVLMHLLAPNHRPQQVTDDLASFWMNTYPLVRKELRARYPKHAWPDDPTTAIAEHRPRRKKPTE